MYKIIGANGTEYGPVTAELIRQWIAEGRINAHTQAQLVGEAGWRAISDFPEFAASFQPAPSTPPVPPPPGYRTTPASPQPFNSGAANPYARQLALDQVSGPSIGLMVGGSLGTLYGLYTFLSNLLMDPKAYFEKLASNMPPQNRQIFENMASMQGSWHAFSIILALIVLVASIFVIIGGARMMKLQSYGICLAAAIISVIPCIGPCCGIVGIPLGIWALVILNRSEVKQQFDQP